MKINKLYMWQERMDERLYEWMDAHPHVVDTILAIELVVCVLTALWCL